MKRSSYLFSTIGRKQIMALAGLGLCLFLLMHAAGNLLIFVGADAYNQYSHTLISNPAIEVIELGLLAIFIIHIISAAIVTVRNRSARPNKYAVSASGEKAATFMSKTMGLQGAIVLGFVVFHLITFKYGTHYETVVHDTQMRDIFRLVHEVFQSPLHVAWYELALLILSFHLSHGVYSLFQTLGFNHPKYSPTLKKISIGFAVVVGVAFAAQPIYMLLFYRG